MRINSWHQRDILLFVFRLVVAAFYFQFGFEHISGDGAGLVPLLSSLGIHQAGIELFGYFELVAAVAILLGTCTRLFVALLTVLTSVLTAYHYHYWTLEPGLVRDVMRTGFELRLFLLGSLVFILVEGPGVPSIFCWRQQRRRDHESAKQREATLLDRVAYESHCTRKEIEMLRYTSDPLAALINNMGTYHRLRQREEEASDAKNGVVRKQAEEPAGRNGQNP